VNLGLIKASRPSHPWLGPARTEQVRPKQKETVWVLEHHSGWPPPKDQVGIQGISRIHKPDGMRVAQSVSQSLEIVTHQSVFLLVNKAWLHCLCCLRYNDETARPRSSLRREMAVVDVESVQWMHRGAHEDMLLSASKRC